MDLISFWVAQPIKNTKPARFASTTDFITDLFIMAPPIIELLSERKGSEMAQTPLPDKSPKNPPLKAGLVERQQVPAAP
jgi:hypothetical protein